MKTRSWILLFCSVIAVCAGALLLQGQFQRFDRVLVYQDGKLIKTLDVNPAKTYTITIECAEGFNTLLVGNGTVRVTDSDCKNQVCVAHGALKKGGTPIVCLPHRLVIRWANRSTRVDAVSGVVG